MGNTTGNTMMPILQVPGHQRDGAGQLWCAVANTAHGRIPGKAKDGTCWYSYGGREFTTHDFQIIPVCATAPQPQGPPHGVQNDGAGELWCAVADTAHGKIPGKAKGGECWYPYGGEEHMTRNFEYAVSPGLEVRAPGFQNDGAGALWCAVANTEHGRIPGKAKDGTCWYSYGGEEKTTHDFEIIHVCALAHEPHGPSDGLQYDSGEYWCAVADTEHGQIPGKAKGRDFWYPYGGQEHHVTGNFLFAVKRQ